MISSARGFGAPDSVPAGKVARKTSIGVASGRRSPSTDGHEVHDVAEPLDLHELGHLDGAGDADLREVVAGEVDEHEVLGLLLRVGEQLVGELDVALRASRRAACEPAIGCVNTRPSCTLTSASGRRADDRVRLAVRRLEA